MGSPPPAGSKNEVLKLRSNRSIVITLASTGKERTRRMAVTKVAQIKRGRRSLVSLAGRMEKIVVMKLMEPTREESPLIWRAKMAISIEGP